MLIHMERVNFGDGQKRTLYHTRALMTDIEGYPNEVTDTIRNRLYMIDGVVHANVFEKYCVSVVIGTLFDWSEIDEKVKQCLQDILDVESEADSAVKKLIEGE